MKRFLKALKEEKGFTLIEILVVIVILAIVAAVVTPMIADKAEDSRTSADNITMERLQQLVDSYEALKGTAPASIDDLVTEKLIDEIPDQQVDPTKSFVLDASKKVVPET